MANFSLPAFTPVPRRSVSHKGWTPSRQKAFIDLLAESSSPTRAARLVNMSVQSAYSLRRHPQAGEFNAAWNAAVDCAIVRLKDVALQRAIEGELVPVFHKGLLVGYRRKFNDALLMFLLRQYGTDSNGKRVTVNYVRTRAEAGAGGGVGGSAASAEASTVTVRTTQAAQSLSDSGEDEARATLDAFEGVTLDAEAEAELATALVESALDQRAIEGTLDDPEQAFVRTDAFDYREGSFESGFESVDADEGYQDGSPSFLLLGNEAAMAEYAKVLEMVEAEKEQEGKTGLGKRQPPDSRQDFCEP